MKVLRNFQASLIYSACNFLILLHKLLGLAKLDVHDVCDGIQPEGPRNLQGDRQGNARDGEHRSVGDRRAQHRGKCVRGGLLGRAQRRARLLARSRRGRGARARAPAAAARGQHGAVARPGHGARLGHELYVFLRLGLRRHARYRLAERRWVLGALGRPRRTGELHDLLRRAVHAARRLLLHRRPDAPIARERHCVTARRNCGRLHLHSLVHGGLCWPLAKLFVLGGHQQLRAFRARRVHALQRADGVQHLARL